jgi:hypothetical protein
MDDEIQFFNSAVIILCGMVVGFLNLPTWWDRMAWWIFWRKSSHMAWWDREKVNKAGPILNIRYRRMCLLLGDGTSHIEHTRRIDVSYSVTPNNQESRCSTRSRLIIREQSLNPSQHNTKSSKPDKTKLGLAQPFVPRPTQKRIHLLLQGTRRRSI